jgi:hypothetical protein
VDQFFFQCGEERFGGRIILSQTPVFPRDLVIPFFSQNSRKSFEVGAPPSPFGARGRVGAAVTVEYDVAGFPSFRVRVTERGDRQISVVPSRESIANDATGI